MFSTKGAEKRAQHGSKGAVVFRDPNEADRVWAIFDWDAEGWKRFASDPEVPPIMQEAGHKGRPQVPSSSAATTPERRRGAGRPAAPRELDVTTEETPSSSAAGTRPSTRPTSRR